jgi:hypothetical protein
LDYSPLIGAITVSDLIIAFAAAAVSLAGAAAAVWGCRLLLSMFDPDEPDDNTSDEHPSEFNQACAFCGTWTNYRELDADDACTRCNAVGMAHRDD